MNSENKLQGQPLFTIATISYNSGEWIRQAIESVLASSFTDFEYLISDDCSSDNTWEIINTYKDKRIRAWRNEKNIGEYPNRNKVLYQARGKYILYIDGDDVLYKDALAEYAKYIFQFPEAKGVWGVFSVFFDFVIFPYLFSAGQLTGINFLSTYPITVVGFTESVFDVDALKQLKGFSENYAIGDTYIKRKFCCYFNVLLIPAGKAFWRQYPEQASNKVRSFYRNLVETYQIDKELLFSPDFPLQGEYLEIARLNFRIRSVKLIIVNTIKKGKVFDFFILMNKLKIPFKDILLIFQKGNYSYKAEGLPAAPLFNEYNFK